MQENTGKIVFLVPDYLTFCYKTHAYCNEMKMIVLQKRGGVTRQWIWMNCVCCSVVKTN